MSKKHTWHWWHSHDGGENYFGPCADREEAIAAGRDYADGEPFIICEARKGELRSFITDRVSEWLDDANEDVENPDGDSISSEITKPQWDDLEKRLDAAAQEWVKAHDLDRHVWLFAETRNEEDIEGESDGGEEAVS